MKSYEWNKEIQSFIEVDNPTSFADIESVEEGIAKAGYSEEITSYDDHGVGATIRVYSNENSKLRFFIDIMGMNCGLATMVARDFPALIETLKQISSVPTFLIGETSELVDFHPQGFLKAA